MEDDDEGAADCGAYGGELHRQSPAHDDRLASRFTDIATLGSL